MAKTATPDTTTPASGGWFNSMSTSEKISYVLLALVLVLVAVIRSKFFEIPFERDEGAYSYYGKLLLEGKKPYQDFYEQKFPGIFYFYAGIVAIFGATVKGMHMGFMVLNMLSIVFLFFAAKKLFSPLAACFTAITYAIVSLTPFLSGFTVQSEHGVAFFTSLGILLYAQVRSSGKSYLYFLMGLALGSAFMTKTTGLFIMLWGGAILVIDFLFQKEKSWKTFLRPVLLYVAGATLVLAVMFLLMAIKGTFKDMIFWTYDIPKNYVNKVPFSEGIKYFGYTKTAILNDHKIFWYHGILALVVCLLKNVKPQMKLFAVSLAAFTSLMIVPGYFFYGHYFIQLVPSLSILSAMTFWGLTGFISQRVKNMDTVRYIYLGAFVLFSLIHLSKQKDYYFNPNYDLILRRVYATNPFPETMEIAKHMKEISKPEDQIIFMGSEPEFYFYMGRNCPTRHAYFAAVVESVPEHKKWQREYSADIEKAKPKYFIFARHSVSLLVQANTDSYIFDWANKYINDNYKLIGVVDMVDGQVNSTYVWGPEALTYQVKGQNAIFVFERKK